MLHPLALNGYFWLAWLIYWYVAGRSASRSKFAESIPSRLTHVLPLLLGLYLIFYGTGFRGPRHHLYNGEVVRWFDMSLTAAGLCFTVWARTNLGRNWSGFVTLKKDHKLIRTGPYKFVRHPIYTGLLMAAIGSAFVASRPAAVVGVCLVLVAFLIKIRHEESLLTQEFGYEYRTYKSEVAALIPFVY